MSKRFAKAYAHALLANLQSDEAASSARDGLARFAEALTEVPELSKMAMSPAVPADVKLSIVTEICEKLSIDKAAHGLLTLLTRNYRLIHLAEVLASMDEALDRRLGIVTAEVTSARDLDDDQRRRLEGVLAAALDRKIDLEIKTDPKLLAGFVARIGSHRYDASLSGQLDRLASRLTQDN